MFLGLSFSDWFIIGCIVVVIGMLLWRVENEDDVDQGTFTIGHDITSASIEPRPDDAPPPRPSSKETISAVIMPRPDSQGDVITLESLIEQGRRHRERGYTKGPGICIVCGDTFIPDPEAQLGMSMCRRCFAFTGPSETAKYGEKKE